MLCELMNSLLGFSELVVSILMLFATVGVAVFAYRISKRQLNLQNYQLKHNLYERRYNIYVELKNDYNDIENYYLTHILKERYDGYNKWYKKYNVQLNFLFDDIVINTANQLKQKLQDAEPEFSTINPKKKIVNEIDSIFIKLRDEIAECLKFKNLK